VVCKTTLRDGDDRVADHLDEHLSASCRGGQRRGRLMQSHPLGTSCTASSSPRLSSFVPNEIFPQLYPDFLWLFSAASSATDEVVPHWRLLLPRCAAAWHVCLHSTPAHAGAPFQ